MKPTSLLSILFSLFAITAFGQVKFPQLQFQPQFPQRGQNLTIRYNPANTALQGEKKVEATAYIFTEKEQLAKEVELVKKGSTYQGSLLLDSNATGVALVFASGDKKDINGDQGYFIPAYRNEKPVKGAGLAHSNLLNGMGNYFFGLTPQPEKALVLLDREWTEFPEARKDMAPAYFYLLNRVKKEAADATILQYLNEIESAGNLSEDSYQMLSSWYSRLKNKEKSEKLTSEMKVKYPSGTWAKRDRMSVIFQEKEPLRIRQLIDSFDTDFPAVTDRDMQERKYLASRLTSAYAAKKDWENFEKSSAALQPSERNMLLNNTAWAMVEKGEDLETAKKMSYEATTWSKNEITNPTSPQPKMSTKKRWEEDRKYTYSMFADTYAFILYKLKDYKNAFTYAKDAVEIRKKKDAEYNDRYAMILSKVAGPLEVQKELEPLMKDGFAGKETKAVLRQAYIDLKHSEEEADKYLVALSQANMEKIRKDVSKKIINENAPKFRLVNLEKKEVNLEELKGKVVVIDFWATWCGPCKASFPAMQRAVDKFKNNPNVVFLFIDTWEKPENREELVKSFITDNKYTFNVLYDIPKKGNDDEFQVVSSYKVEGIPTKFVIDPAGNIRFKSVGFSGNDDAFLEEMSTMIELAAAAPSAKR